MKVELKDKETCTKFSDLSKGDVFVVKGYVSCHMKIEQIYDHHDDEINAVSLENGSLIGFDDWTPVTRIKGKFIEEE